MNTHTRAWTRTHTVPHQRSESQTSPRFLKTDMHRCLCLLTCWRSACVSVCMLHACVCLRRTYPIPSRTLWVQTCRDFCKTNEWPNHWLTINLTHDWQWATVSTDNSGRWTRSGHLGAHQHQLDYGWHQPPNRWITDMWPSDPSWYQNMMDTSHWWHTCTIRARVTQWPWRWTKPSWRLCSENFPTTQHCLQAHAYRVEWTSREFTAVTLDTIHCHTNHSQVVCD